MPTAACDCGARFRVDDKLSGQEVDCPKCGKKVYALELVTETRPPKPIRSVQPAKPKSETPPPKPKEESPRPEPEEETKAQDPKPEAVPVSKEEETKPTAPERKFGPPRPRLERRSVLPPTRVQQKKRPGMIMTLGILTLVTGAVMLAQIILAAAIPNLVTSAKGPLASFSLGLIGFICGLLFVICLPAGFGVMSMKQWGWICGLVLASLVFITEAMVIPSIQYRVPFAIFNLGYCLFAFTILLVYVYSFE